MSNKEYLERQARARELVANKKAQYQKFEHVLKCPGCGSLAVRFEPQKSEYHCSKCGVLPAK